MSLLTDEEIKEIQESGLAGGFGGSSKFAHAIEAAILAKLASAELPEPAGRVMAEHNGFVRGRLYRIEDRVDGKPLYTADQLTAWGNTRFAQGAAAQLAEKPSGYLSQYNLEMLQQGYPQTIVMLEGAKRDVPLYTRRKVND